MIMMQQLKVVLSSLLANFCPAFQKEKCRLQLLCSGI